MRAWLLVVSLILTASFVLSVDDLAFAHRSGCHRWHSCPSDTGSYVCGDKGYTSQCPQGTTPSPIGPVLAMDVSITSPVARGSSGVVTVRTEPSSTCWGTPQDVFSSKVVPSGGVVTWGFSVKRTTNPGSIELSFTCSKGLVRNSKTVTLMII